MEDIFEKFIEDNCLSNAAALSYTTILSLVPLTAILLTLISSYSLNQEKIENYLFKHFIPNAELSGIIEGNVRVFASNATAIGFIGVVFLIISSISLLNTIEGSFNKIWAVKEERGYINKFIIFWGAITIAPILIGLSIFVTAQLQHYLLQDLLNSMPIIQKTILKLSPFIFSWTAFFILYRIIPNVRVKLKPALIGAFIGGTLFEWGKLLFDFYVTNYAISYSKIYGAIASIPVFLVWLYMGWLIVLLGATISYIIQYPREREIDREESKHRFNHSHYFSLRVLLFLCQIYELGKGSIDVEEIEKKLLLPHGQVRQILEKLKSLGMVEFVTGKDVKTILARPPEKILLSELLFYTSGEILKTYPMPDDEEKITIDSLFKETRAKVELAWENKTLMELYTSTMTGKSN